MPVVNRAIVEAAKLRETQPDLIEEDLVLLREWLALQDHLPEIRDQKLRLFLHSCFYNLEVTKKCIEAHYKMRNDFPEYFTQKDITTPEMMKAQETCYSAVMPVPDPEGFRVVYFGLRDTNSWNFENLDANKLSLMTIEGCFVQHGTIPGIIIIQDCKGAGFGHLRKCSIAIARKFAEYNQEANPIRMKGIHLVNLVSWVDTMMYFIKPFMKKEVLSLVHFHSTLESLHEHVPKGCLPEELGGDLGPLEDHHANNTKYLASLSDHFAEEDELDANIGKKEDTKIKKSCDTASVGPIPNLENESSDVSCDITTESTE